MRPKIRGGIKMRKLDQEISILGPPHGVTSLEPGDISIPELGLRA